ncbi:MAG: hypothetical protein RJB66_641 [Pseudomonadota bacterium]|jgi:hypothetical protein
MMHLPPQAYTKETLIQAYNWLRSQPANVQELAKSPEALVALYTRAQMHGDTSLSRMNLQGFKSELKNLASMMGDLEESPSANKTGGGNTKYPPSNTAAATMQPGGFTNSQFVAQNSSSNSPQPVSSSSSMVNASYLGGVPNPLNDPSLPLFSASMSSSPTITDLRNLVDARSWTMIQEVKNHFNLSSEHEAIRLLVAMGYQKMRSQF